MQTPGHKTGKRFALSIVAASCLLAFQAQAAVDCSGIAEWNASVAYNGGAEVQKSGVVYKAKLVDAG